MMVMGRDGKFGATAWPPMVINTANAAQIAFRKIVLPELFVVIASTAKQSRPQHQSWIASELTLLAMTNAENEFQEA
jgi:hypothetical protein